MLSVTISYESKEDKETARTLKEWLEHVGLDSYNIVAKHAGEPRLVMEGSITVHNHGEKIVIWLKPIEDSGAV